MLVETKEAKKITDQLQRDGFGVFPKFLGLHDLTQAREDLQALQKSGRFHPAGTGKSGARVVNERVRGDEIFWLESPGQNSVQAGLLKCLEALRDSFNQALFLGLKEVEAHYASYPKGGSYTRHLDCFRDRQDDVRVVSFILYLNEDWKVGDGGELRIFMPDATSQDIAPLGGQLVCFMSRDFEHEVLMSNRPRLSLSGWFKREH